MNDADFELHCDRARKVFHRWSQALGWGYWDVRLIMDRNHPVDRMGNALEDAPTMTTRFEWEYQWITVTVFVSKIVDIDDAELEYMMVHELTHPYLGPVLPQGNISAHQRAEVENVTTTIARALVRVKRSILEDPRPWSGESDEEPTLPDVEPGVVEDRKREERDA